MCWNKEVSLFSFFIISVVSYALYQRNLKNDRLLSYFVLSYGTIQLFEFLMWLGIDTNQKYLNKIGSILASIVLYIHPLAIVTGMYYDKAYSKYINNPYYKMLFLASLIFVLFGICKVIFNLIKKQPEYSFLSYNDKNNKKLVWDFPSNYSITLLLSHLISIFIFMENKTFWLLFFCYHVLPVLLLFSMDIIKMNYDANKYASHWCWYVAAFSFILYFMNPKLQN